MLGSINCLSLFLPITSLQTLQSHAITHSFAQRRSVISPFFNSFRTLSIATGVVPPPPSTFLSAAFWPRSRKLCPPLFFSSFAFLSPPPPRGRPPPFFHAPFHSPAAFPPTCPRTVNANPN